jgi:hypothetical protein
MKEHKSVTVLLQRERQPLPKIVLRVPTDDCAQKAVLCHVESKRVLFASQCELPVGVPVTLGIPAASGDGVSRILLARIVQRKALSAANGASAWMFACSLAVELAPDEMLEIQRWLPSHH